MAIRLFGRRRMPAPEYVPPQTVLLSAAPNSCVGTNSSFTAGRPGVLSTAFIVSRATTSLSSIKYSIAFNDFINPDREFTTTSGGYNNGRGSPFGDTVYIGRQYFTDVGVQYQYALDIGGLSLVEGETLSFHSTATENNEEAFLLFTFGSYLYGSGGGLLEYDLYNGDLGPHNHLIAGVIQYNVPGGFDTAPSFKFFDQQPQGFLNEGCTQWGDGSNNTILVPNGDSFDRSVGLYVDRTITAAEMQYEVDQENYGFRLNTGHSKSLYVNCIY